MSTFDLPVTIVAGYLGSGKTTYINKRLGDAGGIRYAVLVNDFGELNIDVDLIRSSTANSINLANGCVCCSIANDLDGVLDEVRASAADIDWVLLEASGVADSKRVEDKVMNWPGFRLENTTTLVDVMRIRRLVKDKYVGQHVERQLFAARELVLTKTELIQPGELMEIEHWLESYRGLSKLAVADRCHPEFHSRTLKSDTPISREQLSSWLDQLDESVVRVKGFVYFEDEPESRYLLQWVDGDWGLERDTARLQKSETRIAMISRNSIHPEEMESLF